MPATDYQGTSASFGRSILSLRRDHHSSMESTHGSPRLDKGLESFQKQVAGRFSDLAGSGPDELLSLAWIRELLDSFIVCHEEFRVILFNSCSVVGKSPPLDRMIHDYFDRTVKALDVCNAVRDGVEQVREWKKLIEIVLCALDGQRLVGEGQFRRAKKALVDFSISMLDERDSSAAAAAMAAHRNRSFGRQKDQNHHHRNPSGHFRSLSWSVSRSWSAARQLQAIGNNLAAPRANEIAATDGIAVAVFTMSSVLLFVMWTLVAAIPCQDRGLQVHFSIPRQFPWSAPLMSLHERILDESRKRDRRNAPGLLREIYQMEKCARVMNELADSVHFPLNEEKEKEVRERVKELRLVCEGFNEGLEPLERRVREVFHRIVTSRTEGLDSLGRANYHE